jgi:hypothetical protein
METRYIVMDGASGNGWMVKLGSKCVHDLKIRN